MNDQELRLAARAITNNKNILVEDDATVWFDDDDSAFVRRWVQNPDSPEPTGVWFMVSLRYEPETETPA